MCSINSFSSDIGSSFSKIVNDPSSQSSTLREHQAAVVFQKYIRGYLARKAFLPCSFYEGYSRQVKLYRNYSPMPQAEGGKTIVLLPKEMSQVVLKLSGKVDAIKRFHQMQFVRAILRTQGCAHLVIPKARLYEEFIVEERLPIKVDKYFNMSIYIAEPHLFENAVREMVHFFSKAYLGDLINYQKTNPLSNIVGNTVRCDNLPLYIEEKNGKREGKIGLIDLEHIYKKPNPRGLSVLARIFPYHLDLILKKAQNLGMNIDEKKVRHSAEKGKKFLQQAFIDHLKWLKENGITFDSSSQPKLVEMRREEDYINYRVESQIFQIDENRIKDLERVLEKELLKLNEGQNDLYERRKMSEESEQKDFLVGDLHEVAKEIAIILLPKILERLRKTIIKSQIPELRKIGGKIQSDAEMVRLRTLQIKRSKWHKGIFKVLRKQPGVQFKNSLSLFYERDKMAEQLVHAVIEELVRGGELYAYEPGYRSEGHELCGIRY